MNDLPSALTDSGHRVLLETLYYGKPSDHAEPRATYLLHACDTSLASGIHAGALLIVDPDAEQLDGSIVVIQTGEDLTLRRLRLQPTKYLEKLDCPDDITLWQDGDAVEGHTQCWGILVYAVYDK